jgi:hypothetical protein
MIKTTKIVSILEEWFRRMGGGSLILPDGWFGRPYDNIHQLTYIKARPKKVLIELDEQLYLFITEPATITEKDNELILGGFSQCIFDWTEYGSRTSHSTTYKSGNLKFVAPPGV